MGIFKKLFNKKNEEISKEVEMKENKIPMRSMNQLERKQKSIEILKSKQVPLMEGLPMIEDVAEIEVRGAEEIAKRARIHGKNAPAQLDSAVVFERHWGLNWLIGKGTYNDDWDFVSTDT